MGAYTLEQDQIPDVGEFAVLDPLEDEALEALRADVDKLLEYRAEEQRHFGQYSKEFGILTVQFAFQGEPTWLPPNYEMLLRRRIDPEFVPEIYAAYDGLMTAVRDRPRWMLGGGMVRINQIEPGKTYPYHVDSVPGTIETISLGGVRRTSYWRRKERVNIDQQPGDRTIHRNGINMPFMHRQPPHMVHVSEASPEPGLSLIFEAPL